MRICFFSNYLSPHQIPFSDSIYGLIGDDYVFVSCQAYNLERKKMGWRQEIDKKYELRAYESEENYKIAIQLAKNCDIMIWGTAKYDFIKARLESKKMYIRYSERLFKNGFLSSIKSCDILRQIKFNLTTRSENAYLFCASSFSTFDFSISCGHFKKYYKWGYYPETKRYNFEQLINRKLSNNNVSILWAGRLIDWKHPETAINVAEQLLKENISFTLSIIGTGNQEEIIRASIKEKGLSANVSILGAMSPECVREYMENSDFFIFSSDFNEGWGAVLNESLNSGCVVFCCDEIGSSRYLIEHGENGFMYEYGSEHEIVKQIRELSENLSERIRISKNAYETIVYNWSAEIAAKRFLEWCDGYVKGCPPNYIDGPMSIASRIVPSKRWWKS